MTGCGSTCLRVFFGVTQSAVKGAIGFEKLADPARLIQYLEYQSKPRNSLHDS